MGDFISEFDFESSLIFTNQNQTDILKDFARLKKIAY